MIPASQSADDVAADAGADGDEHAGGDLDDADHQHGLVGVAGHEVVDPRSEVLVPVGQHLDELVEAERDRRDREDGAEQEERLVLVVACGRGERAVSLGVEVVVMVAPFLTDDNLDVSDLCSLTSRPVSFRNGAPTSLADSAAGIAALAEPVRRALYQFVSPQPDAVSREQAAGGGRRTDPHGEVPPREAGGRRPARRGVPQVVRAQRPRGGAPAKLYRRSARGGVAAAAALRPARSDPGSGGRAGHRPGSRSPATPPPGRPVARAGPPGTSGSRRGGDSPGPPPARAAGLRASHRRRPVLLANCPFDRLAQDHTELVCGLNLDTSRASSKASAAMARRPGWHRSRGCAA